MEFRNRRRWAVRRRCIRNTERKRRRCPPRKSKAGANMKLITILFVAGVRACLGQAQNRNQNQANQNRANAEVHVIPAQGNIYMVVGPGGNTTVQVGKDGVLLVDTQFAEVAPKILAEIKKLNGGELR